MDGMPGTGAARVVGIESGLGELKRPGAVPGGDWSPLAPITSGTGVPKPLKRRLSWIWQGGLSAVSWRHESSSLPQAHAGPTQ